MKNKKYLKEIETFLLNELVSKTINVSQVDVGVCNINFPPIFREVFLDFYEPDIAKRKELLAKRIIGMSDAEYDVLKKQELGTEEGGGTFSQVAGDLLGDYADKEILPGLSLDTIMNMDEEGLKGLVVGAAEDAVTGKVADITGLDAETIDSVGNTILDATLETDAEPLEENSFTDAAKWLGGKAMDAGGSIGTGAKNLFANVKGKLGKVDFRALQLQVFNQVFSDENIKSISKVMSTVLTASGMPQIYCVLLQTALDMFEKMFKAYLEQKEIILQKKKKETPPREFTKLDASLLKYFLLHINTDSKSSFSSTSARKNLPLIRNRTLYRRISTIAKMKHKIDRTRKHEDLLGINDEAAIAFFPHTYIIHTLIAAFTRGVIRSGPEGLQKKLADAYPDGWINTEQFDKVIKHDIVNFGKNVVAAQEYASAADWLRQSEQTNDKKVAMFTSEFYYPIVDALCSTQINLKQFESLKHIGEMIKYCTKKEDGIILSKALYDHSESSFSEVNKNPNNLSKAFSAKTLAQEFYLLLSQAENEEDGKDIVKNSLTKLLELVTVFKEKYWNKSSGQNILGDVQGRPFAPYFPNVTMEQAAKDYQTYIHFWDIKGDSIKDTVFNIATAPSKFIVGEGASLDDLPRSGDIAKTEFIHAMRMYEEAQQKSLIDFGKKLEGTYTSEKYPLDKPFDVKKTEYSDGKRSIRIIDLGGTLHRRKTKGLKLPRLPARHPDEAAPPPPDEIIIPEAKYISRKILRKRLRKILKEVRKL